MSLVVAPRPLSQKEKVALLRKRAQTDFYWFCENIVGYPDLHPPLHQQVCSFLSDWSSFLTKILLIPRGHLKSSLASIALPLWFWINNPDTTILLSHGKRDSAVKYLRELKDRMEQNDLLKTLFPEIFYQDPRKESPVWREDEICIKRKKISKVPSMKATGVDASVVGFHFNVVILDDLVFRETIGTPVQRKKTLDYIDQSSYLLLPGGKKLIVGTRWHWDDCYGAILDPRGPYFNSTDKLILDCGWPGEPIFPVAKSGNVGWTRARLQAEYEKNPYEFGCQMMNNPSVEGATYFRRSDIDIFTPEPSGHPRPEEAKGSITYFTSVDPNRVDSNGAGIHDPCAIVTAGYDEAGHLWVVDVTTGHPNAFELAEHIEAHVKRWNPVKVFIETVAGQYMLLPVIQRHQLERGLFYPIQAVERGNSSKDSRILCLQGLTFAKRLHVARGLDEIVHQLVHFKTWKNDDQAEALADIHRLGYPIVHQEAPQRQPRSPYLMKTLLDEAMRNSRSGRGPSARLGRR